MLNKPNINKPVFKIFKDTLKTIQDDYCPICKNSIKEEDFRDNLSRKEYSISGLCQKCQDEIFGK